MGKFISQTQSEKSSSGTKLAKKDIHGLNGLHGVLALEPNTSSYHDVSDNQ